MGKRVNKLTQATSLNSGDYFLIDNPNFPESKKILPKDIKLEDFNTDNFYNNKQIEQKLNNKVDKIEGKGLSTEDYTTTEKQKLSELQLPDQTYDPESENAQSGIAMSQVLASYTNKILQRLIYLRCTTEKDNPVKRIDNFAYDGYFEGYAAIWFEYGCTEISDIMLSGTNYSYIEMNVKLKSDTSFIGLFNFNGNGKVFFIQYFGMDYLQAKFADVNISNAEVQLLVDEVRDISILRKDSKVPAEILIGDPTIDEAAATKRYVDEADKAVAQAVDTCSPAIITTSDTGKAIAINDSSESVIKGLTAYGESVQDGTPTPDSPVEIVSVENPVISVYGKNLIPYPYEETTKTINGITFTDNGDGTITANGTATGAAAFNLQVTVPIAVKNQKVALSGCPVGGSTSSYFILLSYGGNSWPETGSGLAAAPTAPVTIQLRVASGATVNNITFKPQLELGSVATAYEPNSRLQTVTIPYTFRGLKNTSGDWVARDELRVEDGRVETKTSFKKMTFNGTENWSAYTSQSNHFQITVGDNAFGSDSVVRIACNYLPGRAAYSNAGVDYGAFSADGSRLRFKNKDISTVEEWKAWLSELSSNDTPFTVVYKLANDVITDITATEAGQALLALKTNYPTTSVISDIDLNLTYRADTKNYIDNKIAALTALTLEG